MSSRHRTPADRTTARLESAPLVIGVLVVLAVLSVLGYAAHGVMQDALSALEALR